MSNCNRETFSTYLDQVTTYPLTGGHCFQCCINDPIVRTKSFFGRSYNNLPSISECKNNNECIINKKNRTSCKSCRLRKCLMVGMSKSGSRYGRRSNWFKIHCLLQEQQQQGDQQTKQGNAELLLQLEKYTNNNTIMTNNNLSPQISPKSIHKYEDKISSQLSPRALSYTDHSISPSSVDMNMNYYNNMFPQIVLANNYHYYQQIKYQSKRVKLEGDENSEPDIDDKDHPIKDKSKELRYFEEKSPGHDRINGIHNEHYLKYNFRPFRRISDPMESLNQENVRSLQVVSQDADRDPSDSEEQDVPIDLSLKPKPADRQINQHEDSDVDITTYGSDEETIDVTSVPRSKATNLAMDLSDIWT